MKQHVQTRFLFLCIVLIPALSFSQDGLGKKRVEIQKTLTEKKNSSSHIEIQNKESSIRVRYHSETSGPVWKEYSFEDDGTCRTETITADCDSCYTIALNHILDQKKFGWKKINENQYISKFSDFMMLDLPFEKSDYSFRIIRTNWNKTAYRILSGN